MTWDEAMSFLPAVKAMAGTFCGRAGQYDQYEDLVNHLLICLVEGVDTSRARGNVNNYVAACLWKKASTFMFDPYGHNMRWRRAVPLDVFMEHGEHAAEVLDEYKPTKRTRGTKRKHSYQAQESAGVIRARKKAEEEAAKAKRLEERRIKQERKKEAKKEPKPKRERKPRVTQPAECGTRLSFRRGCRCQSCIEAERAYRRGLQEKKTGNPVKPRAFGAIEGGMTHGTRSMYNAGGCRCDQCREAHRTYYREWYGRRKNGS